jgi:S1-C subfamily serine protease
MIFDEFTFHRNQGAVVEVVHPDSPAEAAGIEVGDRIVSINNHQIRSAGILIEQLAITPPNDLVILRLIRNGEELEFAIFLEE